MVIIIVTINKAVERQNNKSIKKETRKKLSNT